MPDTLTHDSAELSAAVDELERLWKLAKQVRDDAEEVLLCSILGHREAPKWFAEMRERIAAGKTTMDDDPPAVEGDGLIPIAEYVAELSGELEIFVAAQAWLVDAQDAYERTDRDNLPIPAELTAAAQKYAETLATARRFADARRADDA